MDEGARVEAPAVPAQGNAAAKEKKRVRRRDLAYPQTVARELRGPAHAELVLMLPERFYQEVTRFLTDGDKGGGSP